MKKNILILFLFGSALIGISQNQKGLQSKKKGNYTLKTVADNTMADDETRITFTFVGPDNKPARSHIKIVCNNDSAFPVIDVNGNYTAELDPGNYKLKFSVPYWREVKMDPINCKAKMRTNITVHFEAETLR